jgi:hypothetical protein
LTQFSTDLQNDYQKELPNGWRYWQVRELVDKGQSAESAVWGRIPESVGNARTCPVHAVLGVFVQTAFTV